jgi:hypothetical protein
MAVGLSHHEHRRFTPVGPLSLLRSRPISCRPLPAAALIVAGAFLCAGCRGPMVEKTYNIAIYQIGLNSVASDVLKETEVSPQIKGSLK